MELASDFLPLNSILTMEISAKKLCAACPAFLFQLTGEEVSGCPQPKVHHYTSSAVYV